MHFLQVQLVLAVMDTYVVQAQPGPGRFAAWRPQTVICNYDMGSASCAILILMIRRRQALTGGCR